eukprot:Opistho-2@77929
MKSSSMSATVPQRQLYRTASSPHLIHSQDCPSPSAVSRCKSRATLPQILLTHSTSTYSMQPPTTSLSFGWIRAALLSLCRLVLAVSRSRWATPYPQTMWPKRSSPQQRQIPLFSAVFRTVRKTANVVRFIQKSGGEVVGRARIKLTVDSSDYSNAGIGSNLIHLFSLSKEYTVCIKQLTADCPLSPSAERATIDCTNSTNCDTPAKMLPRVQSAIDGFGSVFTTQNVSTTLYITVNATGASLASYVDWLAGSWTLVNLVDAGQMPRGATGADFDAGNAGKDGIFVGPTESIGAWRYKQIIKGSSGVYVEQDVTQASNTDVASTGNTDATLIVTPAITTGAAGFRVFGDGTTGRNINTSPYATEGRTVSNMSGTLEGFDASLASTQINCRLWAASVNTSTPSGYGKPCTLGGSVTGTLGAAESATSAPLKMYPPTVVFTSYDKATVKWMEPESKGTNTAAFSAATTEVQYKRCDDGLGKCDGLTGCDSTCPTKTTTLGTTGVALTDLRGDETYYVFRVRTKLSGGDWGELSDPVYARDEPCPSSKALYA